MRDLTLKINDLAADDLIPLELADEVSLNLSNNIDAWKNKGVELCEIWAKDVI